MQYGPYNKAHSALLSTLSTFLTRALMSSDVTCPLTSQVFTYDNGLKRVRGGPTHFINIRFESLFIVKEFRVGVIMTFICENPLSQSAVETTNVPIALFNGTRSLGQRFPPLSLSSRHPCMDSLS